MAVQSDLFKTFSSLLLVGFLVCQTLAEEGTPHGEWPFNSPVRPDVPHVEQSGWLANPIDAFILQKLETKGLRPNRAADRNELLRRVSFDLTGLPPSPEEQHRFLADESPDAYERLVDRLISSPHFGERWAQHWLDLVRFAETEGFKADSLRPNAYKYRDYVIRSFNADRPYRDFVRQQIAGDELNSDDPEAIIATGLNRLYPDENNAANLFQRRNEILNDITKTNSLAFLSLTMGCAQCHDHKFDEIPQVDYYRLRAFFDPIVEQDDAIVATPVAKKRYLRQLKKWEHTTAAIRGEMGELLSEEREKSDNYHLQKFRPEIQKCVLTREADRTPLQEQIARMALKQLGWRFNKSGAVKKLSDEKRKRYKQLEGELAKFDTLKPQSLPRAMAISDVGQAAPPTYVLANGNWRKPTQTVSPGFPSLIHVSLSREMLPLPASTGRRSALAEWLTQPDHPLTSRVIVNRIWQHYFGRGIVPTVNDFGTMGMPPTHRELLDWLAVELVDNNWSLKHIHRLILTSSTYRQSSRIDLEVNSDHARAQRVDGENALLWHQRRRRLEAEAMRDAVLAVSGELNRKLGGPSVRPPLPEGISKRYAWKADKDRAKHGRRSIYVFVKRNMRYPWFDAFDWPDLHSSCGQRSTTTTAPQALLMLNSETTLDLARRWARRLIDHHGENEADLVAEAYSAAFGRPPDATQMALALSFLDQRSAAATVSTNAVKSKPQDNRIEAVTDFCQALFNANEFVMID